MENDAAGPTLPSPSTIAAARLLRASGPVGIVCPDPEPDGKQGQAEADRGHRLERLVRVEPGDGGLTDGQAEAAGDHGSEHEAAQERDPVRARSLAADDDERRGQHEGAGGRSESVEEDLGAGVDHASRRLVSSPTQCARPPYAVIAGRATSGWPLRWSGGPALPSAGAWPPLPRGMPPRAPEPQPCRDPRVNAGKRQGAPRKARARCGWVTHGRRPATHCPVARHVATQMVDHRQVHSHRAQPASGRRSWSPTRQARSRTWARPRVELPLHADRDAFVAHPERARRGGSRRSRQLPLLPAAEQTVRLGFRGQVRQ